MSSLHLPPENRDTGASNADRGTATSLGSRFAEWGRAVRPLPGRIALEWTCCDTPVRDPVEGYLGRIESHELSISVCAHCGAFWLGGYSLATSMMHFEPLAQADAQAFLVAAPGGERRAIMRTWLVQYLQQAKSQPNQR